MKEPRRVHFKYRRKEVNWERENRVCVQVVWRLLRERGPFENSQARFSKWNISGSPREIRRFHFRIVFHTTRRLSSSRFTRPNAVKALKTVYRHPFLADGSTSLKKNIIKMKKATPKVTRNQYSTRRKLRKSLVRCSRKIACDETKKKRKKGNETITEYYCWTGWTNFLYF